ncbi:hypothetical protein V6N13_105048 [Hibiscus sabdariffa]|uniref:Uncharacterized protein n=1 Tax=Hibiscus sabdariffa TaxID=183260 RepID=A0ABR2AW61_9ROSI
MTQVGSGDGLSQALPPFGLEQEEGDDVILMEIISPVKTIRRTKPELSFISCFLLTYNGDRRTTATKANAMATPLCEAR